MFSKISFRITISVPNSLDPDQARQNVGPDLGLSCFQKLSADDKSSLAGKGVKRVIEVPHGFYLWLEGGLLQ